MKYVSEIIFISAIGVIVALSHGENHEIWRELSGILIVVLIFTISSLWAVRTSAFYSSAQERSNFYQYMVDHEENGRYKDKEKIIEDPASQYLRSARSFRHHALIYNMTIFYLLLCFFALFIQFLINLKINYEEISLIELLRFQVLDRYLASYLFIILVIGLIVSNVMHHICTRCHKEIIFFIILLLLLCFFLVFKEENSLRYYYLNILLFSIASYMAYFSCVVFIKIYTGQDPFNNLIIKTYDKMDKFFPFLAKKKDAEINPDVKKENEMVNLWKWSLVLHLKEIFKHIQYDGSLRETWRHNEEHVENLIATLTASEWEDPSILYLYAIPIRLISFLEIDNCYKVEIKKARYENAGKAAEKRWKQLEKKLSYMEDEIECLRKLFKNVDKIAEIIEIEKLCEKLINIIDELNKIKNNENTEQIETEINFLNELLKKLKNNIKEISPNELKKKIDELNNKLPDEKAYKEIKKEIETLKKLCKKINKFSKIINGTESNSFESVKKEIKNICDALIEIYKNRTKN